MILGFSGVLGDVEEGGLEIADYLPVLLIW
jgi:hypothetical protein